jgi:hypothetical protein
MRNVSWSVKADEVGARSTLSPTFCVALVKLLIGPITISTTGALWRRGLVGRQDCGGDRSNSQRSVVLYHTYSTSTQGISAGQRVSVDASASGPYLILGGDAVAKGEPELLLQRMCDLEELIDRLDHLRA